MQSRTRKILTAIGLMSGTSMDGIDIALLNTDGERVVERGPKGIRAYPLAFRKELERALNDARQISEREERPGILAEIEAKLTDLHAEAVHAFIAENEFVAADIDLIGFHGQTVLHRPELRLTVQLGDGPGLAHATKIPVIYDMRANDMRHGGQGAPLVPVYHGALAAGLPSELMELPVAFVNIGGIANITWVGRDGRVIAFDTGPGNALIDQWVQAAAGIPFDDNGMIAAEGTLLSEMLARYMDNPFFRQSIPKSLDRDDFLPPSLSEASLEDGARTLARVTAEAIYRALHHLPGPPRLWVVTGGGRRNSRIVSDLSELANNRDGASVMLAEAVGLDGDAMEAEAWAYLAVRSFSELPLTFPETTGCKKPITGGILARP